MAKPIQPKSQVREYLEAIVWAVTLTFFLRAFVIQAFRIPSESMCDTLLVGDFLFVNKFEYGPKIPFTSIRLPGLRPPRRGDVIVFQWRNTPGVDFIKRCVATGGETLEGRRRQLMVHGKPLVEPYATYMTEMDSPIELSPRDRFGPITLPADQLFMMGDNRDNSSDSRFRGPVEMDLVKGRAMFIYFSTAGDQWWNGFFHVRFDRFFRVIR